jgi:hypothetical protein
MGRVRMSAAISVFRDRSLLRMEDAASNRGIMGSSLILKNPVPIPALQKYATKHTESP